MKGVRLVLLGVFLFMAPLVTVAQHQPAELPDSTAYFVREELTEAAELAGAKRVLRFVQLSDSHILDDDAPYPLRQEPLDPLGPPVDAAQRPQEEYTDEVLDSMIQAINALHAQDAFQFALTTGDAIDNDLENELMRLIDLYDGTSTLRGPISGLTCQPDGQSTSTSDTSHDVTATCTSLPAALAANRTGLADGLPWYSAFGNHDALIQGNVPIEPGFQNAAANWGRRFLQQTEYVAMHFPGADSCKAVPAGSPTDDFGHGYGYAGERLCDDDPDNDGYYAFEIGGVRFIVLDTVNDDFVNGNQQLQGHFNPQTTAGSDIIGGYAEGSIDPEQWAWLRGEIKANPNNLIAIFSHHTLNSMFTKISEGQCAPGLGCMSDLLRQAGYATGKELQAELTASPNVVAWFGGHTHANRIEAKTGTAGGLWNIETSSLIDYPQQGRVVELWMTSEGTKGFWKFDSFEHSFKLSKDLEKTDPQRQVGAIGAAKDQNVMLWFKIPTEVKLDAQPVAVGQLRIRLDSEVTARAGDAANLPIRISNLATGVGVAALNATWEVTHAPRVCSGKSNSVRTDVTKSALTEGGNGTYLGSFTPTEGTTHYVFVTTLPTLMYPATTQVLSLNVEGELQACPSGGKGTPSLGLAGISLAFVLILALRRR